jgi:hypothetical protein
MGTSWGLRGNGWNFTFGGGPTQAAPQFGGFDPSAGASFGTAFNRNGLSGFFNANWSQGYRQSFVSQTPVITLQNGVPGYVSDTSQSPFVISHIPVVGMGGFSPVGVLSPAPPPALYPQQSMGNPAVLEALQRARLREQQREAGHEALGRIVGPEAVQPAAVPQAGQAPVQAPRRQDDLMLVGDPAGGGAVGGIEAPRVDGPSNAERPAMSVAEARRLHAAEEAGQNGEVLALVERGKHAEATGKPNVAKIYYQMALRRASGELKDEILGRIRALEADR